MLRHKIQFDGFGAVDRSVETRNVVPRHKPPVKIEYARDGDVSRLVDQVKGLKHVELVAAVGAGKSTRIPLQLSQALAKLVIHTIPFHIAAKQLASFLAKTSDHVVYMDDLESDYPSHGVVIMTNAFFHAKLARDGTRGLSGAVLYLDEVHESDAATAVLRDVAPSFVAFSLVIRATATANPGQCVTPRLPGQRRVLTYPAVAPTMWNAHDKGKPWSASSLNSNALIVMDRQDVRDRLRQEYQEHGFVVRVCTSRSTPEYYVETQRLLDDPNSGIVVVFVDYAYRSSLTIGGLGLIIESGEVGVPVVRDGAPLVMYRPVFDFETQQLFGRGGRLPGENVTLWKPATAPVMSMCDLESLEGDAANLLYRLMGYRPPINLAAFAYYEGKVPIDLAAAFVSDHPLALCPSESLTSWVNGDKIVALEKSQAGFQYKPGTVHKRVASRGRPTVQSCYTEVDYSRPVTPPPPVPAGYAVTRVDVEALTDYAKSRDSSPSLDTVFTLKSEVPDNLSVLEDGEYQAFAKPKRVAKHVQEQRAAAAELERKRSESAMRITDVSDLPQVPFKPAQVVRQDTVVAKAFQPAIQPDNGIHHFVRDRHDQGTLNSIPDDELGSYFYYEGIHNAVQSSQAFWRGIHSVLQFADRYEARVESKGLPASERLYAMKVLVDEYNHSNAVAMGIQRVLTEVSSRPREHWQDLVNYDELTNVLDWVTEECTAAQARARKCRDAMPLFMDYALDQISPALELEQSVMRTVIEKFERAAVKKDPDKAVAYLESLNQRVVNPNARRSRNLLGYM